MNQDSLQTHESQQNNYIQNVQLKSRLYKTLNQVPKSRYETFEKQLMQASSINVTNNKSHLIPKVALRSRLDPIPQQEQKQQNLGVTINQGRILIDKTRAGLAQHQSYSNLQDFVDMNSSEKKFNTNKVRTLAPLISKTHSNTNVGLFLNTEESMIRANNASILVDESVVGIFNENQFGSNNLKKQLKDRRVVQQQRKKGEIGLDNQQQCLYIKFKGRSSMMQQQQQNQKQMQSQGSNNKDYLTPMDFIHLIRTDPEMIDEFCYLNKCEQPYDFKIVEFEERDPREYMTISARGITHFLDDDATFLTIEDWEHDAKLYQNLRTIEFFFKYKLCKYFSLWKRLMRRNMLIKNQNLMNQQLFSVDRQLRFTLLEVKRLCQNMAEDVTFIDQSYQQYQGYDNYKLAQDKYRLNQLDQKFDTHEKQIKDILISSCQKSLYTFKEENRIPVDNENEEIEDRPPLLVGDESGKEMPYTQEATIRTHYKRLRKFIKLVDFIIIDSKLQLMVNSTTSLVEQIKSFNNNYIESQSSSKQYQLRSGSQCWITVEALYRNEMLQFTPSKDVLVNLFDDIITKSVGRICQKHKEMIQEQEFQIYDYHNNNVSDQITKKEPTDIKQLIYADENFNDSQNNLKAEVNQSFQFVIDYAKHLTPFIQWYKENSQINITQSFKNKEVDEFRQAIANYKKQDDSFQSIEPTQEISIINFDTFKLKEKIKNSAAVCSQELIKFMPDYNYEKATNLVRNAQKLNILLSVLPTSVEQFVLYMENVQTVNSQLDHLGAIASEITSLSLLMDELKIKIPESQKSKIQDVGIQVTQLRKRIDDAFSSQDTNLNRFRKDLEKMVPQVDNRIRELSEKLYSLPIGETQTNTNKLVLSIQEQREQLDQLKEHAKKLNQFQIVLQTEYTQFEKLDEYCQEFGLIEKLWTGRKEWEDFSHKLIKSHFLNVNIETAQNLIEKLQKAANSCAKELDRNDVAKLFKSEIESFRGVLSVLTSLRDPALKEKEWTEIRQMIIEAGILGEEAKDVFIEMNNSKYTVEWIQKQGFGVLKDKLSEIAIRAAKEVELVRMIEGVESVWRQSSIVVASYKDNKEISILGNNEDLISKIDDTLLTVNNILASRYVEGIRPRVEQQLKLLRYFQELFDEWMLHQRNWLYLEPILNSPYSVKNLAKESKIFQQADSAWKKMMRQVRDNPVAKRWADDYQQHIIFNMLHTNNNNFDLIQKALDDFLEKKREVFQRFFFLSNDELLEILSSAQSLQTVQPFLRKCFENIVRLQFDKQDSPIGMISAEGEIVALRNYTARGSEVEEWLKSLEEQMKYSLKVVIRQAYIKYDQENTLRKDWVLEYPLQVVVSLDSVFWTKITEETYLSPDSEGDLDDWYEANVQILDELTLLIRGDLTELQRRTLVALVTQDVHFRDIVDNMRSDSIDGIMDFKWQQQLRFYYEDEQIHARQVNAKLMYGYEYLGSTTRLVITPLTDRCWMTITGALGIKLGAAPQGPAGTGKTESCKDLAKALGRYCIVFNCSDQITAKMMEKLFAGLAYCGAWVCLDEFNRIYIEVLSVIAQQVQTIREALLENKQTFMFFGKNVLLNSNLGIFITMNPGYAGRTELPDNLKVLFRPVAMMVPDYRLIAEIMLFAEGFSNARDLSRKMTKLYKLSSEQLSQQDHYDFGMRAVKSLLVMAGSLKRADPDLSEDIVLVRAMREANIPKFLSHDIPLFNAIVTDLFPGLSIPITENKEFNDVIKEQIKIQNLQIVPNFIDKVIQLHETLKVRFGVMLVGATFGGKSACLNTLRQTYINLYEIYTSKGINNHSVYQNIEQQILNPKSISMEELYGQFDLMSQQWTDGLASNILRTYSSLDTLEKKWVVFDGPVDALWIENMNTVLDDSMTLCLSNGERVKLKPQMRMLFEVLDLSVASPATVSRCGMVYIDDQVVGYQAIVSKESITQLSGILTSEIIGFIEQQVQLSFQKCIPTIQKKTKQLIQVNETQLAVSVIRILKMSIVTYQEEIKLNAKEELNRKHIEKLFLWAFCWAIGSTLTSDTVDVFERLVTESFPLEILPRGSVMDYLIKIVKNNEGVVSVDYLSFHELVPEFEYTKGMSYFDMIVQTKETLSFGWFLKQCISVGQFPLLITGTTGTGKTTMASTALAQLQQSGLISLLQMTFSAKTQASVIQISIEQKLQTNRKNKRTILMPPPGKKLVVFVDDANMPATEQYGAQPPIELLRQFIDYRGVYDRKAFFWKDIESTALICACGAPGGGRSQLTPRFTRHFTLMALPNSSERTLTQIFSTIVKVFFKQNNFKAELIELSDQGNIVIATLQIYNEIQKVLLPTPEKSHYVFNLRDVSRVFQGLLLARPMIHTKIEQIARLWAHETCRVFMDRLINQQDQDWFKKELVKSLFLFFKLEYTVAELFESVPPLLFADFTKRGIELSERIYDEVRDYNQLLKVINEYMSEETKLNLVLFKDAVEHLSRIARVLRQQRGNFMLVGVGGSGKKSLTTLAASLAGCVIDTLESKKNYGKKEFKEDLFRIMCKVAIDGKIVAFSFSDTQIVQEGFLEDINNLLNSGEVPNMLTKEDMDIISSGLGNEARENKQTDVYGYFVQKVRSNLHIILAMSPVGGLLRVRLRMFPSLVNCCTIQWLQKWPEEALLDVAQMFLENLEFEGLTQELRNNLYGMCVTVHQSVEQMCPIFFNALRRNVYVTPKTYLNLIDTYKELLKDKKEELLQNKMKLSQGLNKLTEANSIIKDLKDKLTDLQPILKIKTAEQDQLIAKLEVDSVSANKVKVVVYEEERQVNEKASKIREMKSEADKILNDALPILQAASEALNTLNRNDISEIKSNNNPHQIVRFTLECVAILLDEKQDWDTIKKCLADPNFLSRMKNLNVSSITIKTQQKIQQKISSNPLFVPSEVLKINFAAKSMCEWVRAVSEFTEVNREIEKKKTQVELLNSELSKANSILKGKQEELAAVIKKVNDLEALYNENKKEKDRLDEEIATTVGRLTRADLLTVGLADEQERWKETVISLGEEIKLLLGNIFLASATISYLGAFTGQYRNELLNGWLVRLEESQLPFSKQYSFEHIVGEPIQIQNWGAKGLPNDSVSISNGIIQQYCRQYPLFIDPQQQANKWIKNLYIEEGIKVIKQGSEGMLKSVENCIRQSFPLIIEDVIDSLEQSLEPLLLKQFTHIGRRTMLRLGDSDLEINPNFRLYFSTKQSNPQFLPDVFIRVTVINFSITEQGLEEQLLGDVVRKEMPDIEQTKQVLIQVIAKGKANLKRNEERILDLLAQSKGLILDNIDLIENLKLSKIDAAQVTQSLIESEQKQIEIEQARALYLPIAIRGSTLYFVISDFTLVDPMYQFSLTYFKKLFGFVITNTEKSSSLDTRISNLLNAITETIYSNVCRGLFNPHKRIFSFLMAAKIYMKSGAIIQSEWSQFVRGAPISKISVSVPKEIRLTEKQWNELNHMSSLNHSLDGLTNNIQRNFKDWELILHGENPWDVPVPEIQSRLTPFQKLLLIRILRQEETLQSMSYFVDATLGKKFSSNTPAGIDEVFQDTDCKTPLIFILSAGADPLSGLLRFANQRKILADKLTVISLGQGQGIVAEKAIETQIKSGGWVILQNCHLGKSYMPLLEKRVESFEDPELNAVFNQNFRLILTSMPCEYFPVSILQNGVKLTTEPPKGLKSNIYKSYSDIPQEYFEGCEKNNQWKKLLYSLAFFHAVVQERRKFGPLGWNIRYEFNDSDFETSYTLLRNFLDLPQDIPWDAINYVIGEISYGGRVTDDWDRRSLLTILAKFINEDVLADGYKFSESGTYSQVPIGSLEDYKFQIDKFPDFEKPEVFGMNENANITFKLTESKSAINTILYIQPREQATPAPKTQTKNENDLKDIPKTQDQIIEELCEILMGKLPPLIKKKEQDLIKTGGKQDKEVKKIVLVKKDGIDIDSLRVCVSQEVQRFNKLIVAIQISINNLRKAIKGEVVMSQELDGMYQSLLNNQVPQLWAQKAYLSLKPLASFYDDMIGRVNFFQNWYDLENGQTPKCYWISSFFFPQGFLTSVLQTFARKNQIPIDILGFSFKFMNFYDTEQIFSSPESGAYINGLYTEGTRFDLIKMNLEDSFPGQTITQSPIIHFIPTENYKPDINLYSMPLYKTNVRAGTLSTTGHSTNFIISIECPTKKSPDYWVLNGAAFVCQHND